MRKRFFLIIVIFSFAYSNSHANVYLDKILEFLTGRSGKEARFSSENILNISLAKDKDDTFKPKGKPNLNRENTQNATSTKNVTKVKGYLGKIFKAPSITSPSTSNSIPSGSDSGPARANPLSSFGGTPGFAGTPLSGGMQSAGAAALLGVASGATTPSTSLPTPSQETPSFYGQSFGECNIPKGPIAYNIGGNSVSCKAATIVAGFKQPLRSGAFGAGYINPLLEKGMSASGASVGNCRGNTASQYGEKCFKDYSSGSALAYIQSQVLHWQQQGAAKGQKCVPVDIDNCDSIGSKNYLEILNYIEKVNNQGSVKIKVLSKNPHLGGCNFFSHPAVVGAFIEEISPGEALKVSKMRSRADQILLFARGGSGSNKKLKQIEALKIPNSSYSYDAGAEYEKIIDCTYNP